MKVHLLDQRPKSAAICGTTPRCGAGIEPGQCPTTTVRADVTCESCKKLDAHQ